MSRENIDLVTRALRAATALPKPDFGIVNALFHPDHVLVTLYRDLEGGELRGGRGYQQFLQQQGRLGLSDTGGEAPMSWETRFEGAVDVSTDKVLAACTTRFRGAASGAEVEQRLWLVVTVRESRVFRTEVYPDPAAALGAVNSPETTSSTNLDVVRSLFSAWERGDYRAIDWAHPEVEFVITDGPSPGRWEGREGLAEAWRGILGAWENLHHEVDEYRELDSERVLVLHRWSGRGRASGLDVDQTRTKAALLFHVHNGLVTRLVAYFDRDQAFADLGLPSEASSHK